MSASVRASLFMVGTDALSRPRLARVDVDGDRVEVFARPYVDPIDRSGRGGSSGVITALARVRDVAGGDWLLATVERGRPRLIDPGRLGVVALLGRRREWRGAAEQRSPFLPVICDRAPQQGFVLSRSPWGELDLVRVRPGAAIERWSLGEVSERVELLARPGALALVGHGRAASIELDELVPGGHPLTDPRDVELPLRWRALPAGTVAACDLLASGLRVITREGSRFGLAQLDGDARIVARVDIPRPQRWLAGAGFVWLRSDDDWRVIAGGEEVRATGLERAKLSLELDAAGRPWLWAWHDEARTLERLDGRSFALEHGWALPEPLRPLTICVEQPLVAGEPGTIVHADELAELWALEPELASRWARWFEPGAGT